MPCRSGSGHDRELEPVAEVGESRRRRPDLQREPRGERGFSRAEPVPVVGGDGHHAVAREVVGQIDVRVRDPRRVGADRRREQRQRVEVRADAAPLRRARRASTSSPPFRRTHRPWTERTGELSGRERACRAPPAATTDRLWHSVRPPTTSSWVRSASWRARRTPRGSPTPGCCGGSRPDVRSPWAVYIAAIGSASL